MMKITGLSHLFKWDNLHNWWLTKYYFAPLYTEYRCFFFLMILIFKIPQYRYMSSKQRSEHDTV